MSQMDVKTCQAIVAFTIMYIISCVLTSPALPIRQSECNYSSSHPFLSKKISTALQRPSSQHGEWMGSGTLDNGELRGRGERADDESRRMTRGNNEEGGEIRTALSAKDRAFGDMTTKHSLKDADPVRVISKEKLPANTSHFSGPALPKGRRRRGSEKSDLKEMTATPREKPSRRLGYVLQGFDAHKNERRIRKVRYNLLLATEESDKKENHSVIRINEQSFSSSRGFEVPVVIERIQTSNRIKKYQRNRRSINSNSVLWNKNDNFPSLNSPDTTQRVTQSTFQTSSNQGTTESHRRYPEGFLSDSPESQFDELVRRAPSLELLDRDSNSRRTSRQEIFVRASLLSEDREYQLKMMPENKAVGLTMEPHSQHRLLFPVERGGHLSITLAPCGRSVKWTLTKRPLPKRWATKEAVTREGLKLETKTGQQSSEEHEEVGDEIDSHKIEGGPLPKVVKDIGRRKRSVTHLQEDGSPQISESIDEMEEEPSLIWTNDRSEHAVHYLNRRLARERIWFEDQLHEDWRDGDYRDDSFTNYERGCRGKKSRETVEFIPREDVEFIPIKCSNNGCQNNRNSKRWKREISLRSIPTLFNLNDGNYFLRRNTNNNEQQKNGSNYYNLVLQDKKFQNISKISPSLITIRTTAYINLTSHFQNSDLKEANKMEAQGNKDQSLSETFNTTPQPNTNAVKGTEFYFSVPRNRSKNNVPRQGTTGKPYPDGLLVGSAKRSWKHKTGKHEEGVLTTDNSIGGASVITEEVQQELKRSRQEASSATNDGVRSSEELKGVFESTTIWGHVTKYDLLDSGFSDKVWIFQRKNATPGVYVITISTDSESAGIEALASTKPFTEEYHPSAVSATVTRRPSEPPVLTISWGARDKIKKQKRSKDRAQHDRKLVSSVTGLGSDNYADQVSALLNIDYNNRPTTENYYKRTKRYYSSSSQNIFRSFKPKARISTRKRKWSWRENSRRSSKLYCLALSKVKQHESLCGAKSAKESGMVLGCTRQKHYSLPLSQSLLKGNAVGRKFYVTVWEPGSLMPLGQTIFRGTGRGQVPRLRQGVLHRILLSAGGAATARFRVRRSQPQLHVAAVSCRGGLAVTVREGGPRGLRVVEAGGRGALILAVSHPPKGLLHVTVKPSMTHTSNTLLVAAATSARRLPLPQLPQSLTVQADVTSCTSARLMWQTAPGNPKYCVMLQVEEGRSKIIWPPLQCGWERILSDPSSIYHCSLGFSGRRQIWELMRLQANTTYTATVLVTHTLTKRSLSLAPTVLTTPAC